MTARTPTNGAAAVRNDAKPHTATPSGVARTRAKAPVTDTATHFEPRRTHVTRDSGNTESQHRRAITLVAGVPAPNDRQERSRPRLNGCVRFAHTLACHSVLSPLGVPRRLAQSGG